MPEYRFHYVIDVRYGDLDPQGHVNNARFITYMEQARFVYLQKLGLWDGRDFYNLGVITADVKVSYLAPILLNQKVDVAVRTSQMGNKSIRMEYRLTDSSNGKEHAHGIIVMVAYDYHTRTSKPIPDSWRQKIAEFENIPLFIETNTQNHSLSTK
jgi:acyl-CoA thioester hydrolase